MCFSFQNLLKSAACVFLRDLMSLTLSAMSSDDLVVFLKKTIPYYAQMMLDVGEYNTYEAAHHQSYTEIMSYFSAGQVPASELLYNMVETDTDETVGSLWLSMIKRQQEPLIFISYITVEENYRRQGYARKVLSQFEQLLRPHGYNDFELYVFVNNIGAIKLYERTGYRIVNKKPLGQAKHITRFVMKKKVSENE